MNTLPINTGDTAFMILCTAMVCLMTPGLAFFYGGLARKNNILTIMSQSFLSVGITTIMWVFGGFGLAFGRDIGGVIGNPGFESIPRTRFVRIFSRFQRVSISSFRPAVKPKPFDR
ncbi:hypothetical protein EfmAA818_15460 [Enterococcus faecium]|nr:hypothetical protein EfmKUHS13_14820 [Enterococcus faecium]BDP63955.1 hypothetical protein EfmJHP80_14510 [Enterococcus faecium]BDP87950.1 hypothetical protein EfmAA818_15460 [Enterococcus faecium]BEK60635.1 hypothetical protein SUGS_112550 [Enterococcus faecium]